MNLHSDAVEGDVGVAISHSCDIANENLEVEPLIEFALAKPVIECDGALVGAKNPRRLHLRTRGSDQFQGLELRAYQKFRLQKTKLADQKPDSEYKLAEGQLQILQSWLAARYRRQAFPDALQQRLKPLFTKMEKQGGKNAHGILGYWLDYQPRDEELLAGDPYEVWLSVVYSVENPDFELAAKEVVATLERVTLTDIDLSKCMALSEEEFTLKDLREQVHYQADHLSYRTDPPGPIVGE